MRALVRPAVQPPLYVLLVLRVLAEGAGLGRQQGHVVAVQLTSVARGGGLAQLLCHLWKSIKGEMVNGPQ